MIIFKEFLSFSLEEFKDAPLQLLFTCPATEQPSGSLTKDCKVVVLKKSSAHQGSTFLLNVSRWLLSRASVKHSVAFLKRCRLSFTGF